MNLRNIYDSRRIWKMVLLAVSLILVAIFIYFSNNLVKDLAKQERERMEIWADATRELTTSTETDVDFLFRIIQGNRNIPVLLVDEQNNIIEQRNFKLPEPGDTAKMIDEYSKVLRFGVCLCDGSISCDTRSPPTVHCPPRGRRRYNRNRRHARRHR